jgi:hypothetical protein
MSEVLLMIGKETAPVLKLEDLTMLEL